MNSKVSERDSKRYNLLDRIVGALGFGSMEFYESKIAEKRAFYFKRARELEELANFNFPDDEGLNNRKIAERYLRRYSPLKLIFGGRKSLKRLYHGALVLNRSKLLDKSRVYSNSAFLE